MSIVIPGQVGQFRGKIGQVVICKWRGMLVGRKCPGKRISQGSEEQLIQQEKFGRVSAFLRHFSAQIAIGWASDKKKVTAINEAVSHHLKSALNGVYPDYEINFERVLISRGRGKIDGGFRPVAKAGPEASVDISWTTCNSTSRITQPTDQLTVIFIDENFRPGVVRPVSYDRIAQRSDLKTRVFAPWQCVNHPLHVYIFFSSDNGKLASRSEYLGTVTPL